MTLPPVLRHSRFINKIPALLTLNLLLQFADLLLHNIFMFKKLDRIQRWQ